MGDPGSEPSTRFVQGGGRVCFECNHARLHSCSDAQQARLHATAACHSCMLQPHAGWLSGHRCYLPWPCPFLQDASQVQAGGGPAAPLQASRQLARKPPKHMQRKISKKVKFLERTSLGPGTWALSWPLSWPLSFPLSCLRHSYCTRDQLTTCTALRGPFQVSRPMRPPLCTRAPAACGKRCAHMLLLASRSGALNGPGEQCNPWDVARPAALPGTA